jgi:hypothetical protein
VKKKIQHAVLFLLLGFLGLAAFLAPASSRTVPDASTWKQDRQQLQSELSKSSKAQAIHPTSTPYIYESYLNSTVLVPGGSWALWDSFPSTVFMLDDVASGTRRQFELARLAEGCYDLEFEWSTGDSVRQFSFLLLDRIGRPIRFEHQRSGRLSLQLVPSIYRIEVNYAGRISRSSKFVLRASQSSCGADTMGWAGKAPEVSRYRISMSPQAAGSFEMLRRANLERLRLAGADGTAIQTTNAKVAATIWQDDYQIPSKVRIWAAGVGDAEHFEKHHPSMTVEIDSGPLLQGMRKFKLYNLRSAGGYLDYVTNGLASLEGLMVPRQRLVSVSFDGREAGLYVAMELPSKEFLLGTGRHDGTFLDFTKGGTPALPGYLHSNVAARYLSKIDSRQTSRFLAFVSRFNGTHGLNTADTRLFVDRLLPAAVPILRDVNVNYWADNGLALRSFLSHASWWLIDGFFQADGPHLNPIAGLAGDRQDSLDHPNRYYADHLTLGLQEIHPALRLSLRDPQARSDFDRYLLYYGLNRDLASQFITSTAQLDKVARPFLQLDPVQISRDMEARVGDPFSGTDVSVGKAIPHLANKARLVVIPGDITRHGKQKILLYNFSAFSLHFSTGSQNSLSLSTKLPVSLAPARLYAYLENDLDGRGGVPPLGRMTPRVAKTAAVAEMALQSPDTNGLQAIPLQAVSELTIHARELDRLIKTLRTNGVLTLPGGLNVPPEFVVTVEQLPDDDHLDYVPSVNRNGEKGSQLLADVQNELVLLPAGQLPTADGMLLRYLIANQSKNEARIDLRPIRALRWRGIRTDAHGKVHGEFGDFSVSDATFRLISTTGTVRGPGFGSIILPGMKHGPATQVSDLYVDGLTAVINGTVSGEEAPSLALLDIRVNIEPDSGEPPDTLWPSNQRNMAPPLLGAIRHSVFPKGLSVVSHEPRAWVSYLGRPQIQEEGKSYSLGTRKTGPITLASGRIDSVLVIGPSQDLRINPGTNLEFGHEGGLLVFGRVDALGTEKEPITMKASDGTWRGIAVVNAHVAERQPSRLHNVKIDSVRKASLGPVTKLGAAQFVRTKIELKNVKLTNLTAEDGVNFYRSDFDLENVTMVNAADDCIDSDWSWGTVSQVVVSSCGGDGIDLNNSLVEITRAKVTDSADKAISVGEASLAKIKASNLHGGKVALAVKDSSWLFLGTDVSMSGGLNADIVLYVKNAMLGAGRIDFLGAKDEGDFKPRIIDLGSHSVTKTYE